MVAFLLWSQRFLTILKIQNSFERYPLEKLAVFKKLGAFKHHGFWQCVDTIRDKEFLRKLKKKN